MGKIKEKFIEEQEENRRMDNEFLDFQSREGRLNKSDFKLAEGDDSWGFENSPLKLGEKMPLWLKIIYALIIGYFAYYIIEAVTYLLTI
jgi:hypothetical protein